MRGRPGEAVECVHVHDLQQLVFGGLQEAGSQGGSQADSCFLPQQPELWPLPHRFWEWSPGPCPWRRPGLGESSGFRDGVDSGGARRATALRTEASKEPRGLAWGTDVCSCCQGLLLGMPAPCWDGPHPQACQAKSQPGAAGTSGQLHLPGGVQCPLGSLST